MEAALGLCWTAFDWGFGRQNKKGAFDARFVVDVMLVSHARKAVSTKA